MKKAAFYETDGGITVKPNIKYVGENGELAYISIINLTTKLDVNAADIKSLIEVLQAIEQRYIDKTE